MPDEKKDTHTSEPIVISPDYIRAGFHAYLRSIEGEPTAEHIDMAYDGFIAGCWFMIKTLRLAPDII